MEFIKKNIGYLVALAGFGFFLYAFNLHVPLFWDDADWIVNNPYVHKLTWENIKFIFSHDTNAGIGLVSNYYRPFLFLTLMANYLISGTDPVLYHLVNNLIHIGNGIFIFFLLNRWLKRPLISFISALLFIIHPLQTEAIAIVSGRGDPLSVFLVLFGITTFLMFKDRGRYWFAYGTASIAMILAILSRETTVLFPAYLGIILMAFENQGRIMVRFKKSFVGVLPFIGIALVYGLLRLTVLNFQNTLNFYQQQNIYSENLIYRIYTFFHALVVYFRLIFWPTGLHMDRDIPVSIHIWNSWSWLGALIIVFLLVWLILLYRKALSSKSSVSSSSFNIWFFGTGIFFVNLLPTSGIIPINARIYEHWLYFSLFGVFTIVAFYLDRIFIFLKSRNSKIYPVVVIFLIAYFLFLGIQTIRRNLLWSNTEKFYLNILSYQPDNVRVLNNLGNWYSDRGNNLLAKPLYERAVEIDPTQPALFHNLGNIARDSGQLDQAEVLYKKAISVNPEFHYAYGNLAQIYFKQNRLSEALAELQKLQEIYPSIQTQENIEMLKKLINS